MDCTFALLLFFLTDPGIPWGDLSDQGEGAGLRVGEVQALHLHHQLAHYVVAAVAVKGQHHKVQCQNLRGKGCRNKRMFQSAIALTYH